MGMGRVAIPAAAIAAFAAAPALASVEDGLEAWTRGEYAAAVRQWQASAATGDANAQYYLARAYLDGKGVAADRAKAEELFEKSAKQGNPLASDNFGLILYNRGEYARAMPLIRAASDRGDPRAQYLMGVAHYKGDLAELDEVRGYALVRLAKDAGLQQADLVLGQMDQQMSLTDRREAITLSIELREAIENARQKPAEATAANLARPAKSESPEVPPVAEVVTPAPAPLVAAVQPPDAPGGDGPWQIQLGAFAVRNNADALWKRVKNRPELAGRDRLLLPSGRVTLLLATGFPTKAAAQSACFSLGSNGVSCLVTRN